MDNAGHLIGKPKILSEEIEKVLQRFLPGHLCLLEESGKKTNQQVRVKEREPTSSWTHTTYGNFVKSYKLADSSQNLSFDAVGATDSLGFVHYYPTNFRPLTNEYTIWENGMEMRYFVIEAPGITEADLSVEELDGGEVQIKMMKKKFISDLAESYTEEEGKEGPKIRQSDGPFHCSINLYRHETTSPLYTLEHGMFVMKMKKRVATANRGKMTEVATLKMELSLKLEMQKTLASFGHKEKTLEDEIEVIEYKIANLNRPIQMNKAKQPAVESKGPPHEPDGDMTGYAVPIEEYSTLSIQSGSDVQMSEAASSDVTDALVHRPPADRTALESRAREIITQWTKIFRSRDKKVYDSSLTSHLDQLVKDLRNSPSGTIVVIPTDTVYCLAARASDEAGIANLYKIKGRAQEKPVSFWMSTSYMDKSLDEEMFSEKLWKAMHSQKVWPGKTALVVNKGNHLNKLFPGWRTSKCGTVNEPGRANSIALRVPDCAVLNTLMDQAGPLAVTSANVSGAADEVDWPKTWDLIKDKPYVLGVMAGQVAKSFEETGEMASSVIDVKDWPQSDEGDYMDHHVCGSEVTVPKFLRKGVNFDSIQQELSEIFEVASGRLPDCE